MIELFIKILIALGTFTIAILAISDLKSIRDKKTGENTPWYRRLTVWGHIKLFVAGATLLLGGADQYLTSTAASAAAAKAIRLSQTINKLEDQSRAQQRKLDDTKTMVASAAKTLASTSRMIDLFDKSLASQRVFLGNYRALMHPLSGVEYTLTDNKDQQYQPMPNDKIDYSVICRGGNPPPAAACKAGGYGYLIADADKFPILKASGFYIFRGTATTGQKMTYEAPTGDCEPVRQQLESGLCEVDLDVSRTSNLMQLDQMKKEGFPFNTGLTDAAHDDLCRAYEILYGNSCQHDLPSSRQR